MNLRALVVTSALAGTTLFFGCGKNNLGGGYDGDGGPPSDGGSGDQCTATADCAPGLTCNTSNGKCEDTPCTTNNDCDRGSYCTPGGVCQGNDTGGTCVGDQNCKGGETCIGGFCGCDGDQFTAQGVPPNVLIVLDRSGSMGDPVSSGSPSKWDIATGALGTLLANYGDKVNWGLALYEGASQCAPGTVVVDTGAMTSGAINTALGNNSPGGRTPIGDTLDALLGYSGLADATRENYILLLTDGTETCNGDGETAVTNLINQTPSVKTFVVGFGGAVDGTALNNMAQNGGTALAGGPPYYYQADDAASLAMAFDNIGSTVLSCTYNLSGNPGADDLYVYFDSVNVTRDPTHMSGWDYDPTTNQVTFYGADCDKLKAGTVTDLVIVGGCPIVVN